MPFGFGATLKLGTPLVDSANVNPAQSGGDVGAVSMEPSDFFTGVLGEVLGELIATQWLLGLVVVSALAAAVRAARAVIHGGRPRDPQRRFSRPDRAEILARAGNRCEQHSWLYGRCRETESLQADHVHPHSRGGVTAIENGQALCRWHNKQKSARVPWNWELARLAKRRATYFPSDASRVVIRHRASADQSTAA
ncbi:HNH endonuclease [Geodermatophilus sp. SYSU D01186]